MYISKPFQLDIYLFQNKLETQIQAKFYANESFQKDTFSQYPVNS